MIVNRFGSFAMKHFNAITFAAYGVVIAVLYFPALNSSFMGDDFNYLRFLTFYSPALLRGESWEVWTSPIYIPGVWIHFRPLPPVFILLDYLIAGFNPISYHITDFVLHLLNSFLVFLLCLQLLQRRWAAAAAGILFAAMPVHLEAVSWFAARADDLSTVWFLLCVVFFIYFRQRQATRFFAFSFLAFCIGMLAKESLATAPVLIALYDLLYHTDSIRRVTFWVWHLPFWLSLLVYTVFRIFLLGQSGTNLLFSQARFLDSDWISLTQAYIALVLDPFVSNPSLEIGVGFCVVLALALFTYRNRREIWFGVAWLAVAAGPAFVNTEHAMYDRFVYLPSIGLAIVLASVLTRPMMRLPSWSRALGTVALGGLVIFYGATLYSRNEAWARTAQVTRIVSQQVQSMHSSMPSNARLVFVGLPPVPAPVGVQAFGYLVQQAMQITFRNPQLTASSGNRFPIWLDNLDHTFFFEYSRRKVTERTDLIRALEQRRSCETVSTPAVMWNFSEGAQDWEAWNDLSDLTIRDGVLVTQSSGNDPYMASPEIAIPALALGEIEIVMRVRSDAPTTRASVYWLASSQNDFSPGLQISFPVQADGDWHTYRVDIAQSKQLLIGDKVTRLRLDPVDAPAEIAFKSIQVFVHCNLLQGDQCICS